jgi:hypothetical protein
MLAGHLQRGEGSAVLDFQYTGLPQQLIFGVGAARGPQLPDPVSRADTERLLHAAFDGASPLLELSCL